MISEGLKNNSTLTELDLTGDEKEQRNRSNNRKEERENGNQNDINEINREQYWKQRRKDDK